MKFSAVLFLGLLPSLWSHAAITWEVRQHPSIQCDSEIPEMTFKPISFYSHDNAAFFLWSLHLMEQFDDAAVNESMQSIGFDRIDFINPDAMGGSEALIASTSELVVIVFRGSLTIKDGIIDAMFLQQKSTLKGVHGAIHRGIHQHFHGMKDEILSILQEQKHNKKPIYITGHSLGGGLAQLAGLFLAHEGYSISSVYTSASPRIGNAEFLRNMELRLFDKIFSLVTEGDLVPHLPPSQWQAHEFADTLPKQAPLKQQVRNLAENLDYDVVPGDLYFIPRTGIVKRITRHQKLTVEGRFWKEISGTLRNGTFKDLLRDLQSRFQSHGPNGYFCKLVRSLPKTMTTNTKL